MTSTVSKLVGRSSLNSMLNTLFFQQQSNKANTSGLQNRNFKSSNGMHFLCIVPHSQLNLCKLRLQTQELSSRYTGPTGEPSNPFPVGSAPPKLTNSICTLDCAEFKWC